MCKDWGLGRRGQYRVDRLLDMYRIGRLLDIYRIGRLSSLS